MKARRKLLVSIPLLIVLTIITVGTGAFSTIAGGQNNQATTTLTSLTNWVIPSAADVIIAPNPLMPQWAAGILMGRIFHLVRSMEEARWIQLTVSNLA